MNQKKDIFIEGENIENLFSDDLHPFLKWGMTWLFAVGFLLFGMTYFLKWPEVVKAPAVLTSSETPTPIVAKVQAKISALHCANGDIVKAGAVLLTLDNTADEVDVAKLDSLIAQTDSIYQTNVEQIVNLPIAYFELDNLGEMQTSYEQFLRAYSDLKYALSDAFLSAKLNLIFSRYKTLQDLGLNLRLQRNTIYQEYEGALATYEKEKQLYEKGSITAYELKDYESQMHNKRLSFQNIKNSIIQNERQLQDLQEQKIQLTQGIEVQKNNFIQAFKSLKSTVSQWQSTYVLKSPISGVVSMPLATQKNAVISPQSAAMYILPNQSNPIVVIQLPQSNLNSMDTTKQVRIKLNAFAYEKYGVLQGQLQSIGTMPNEGIYEAKVKLTDGLKTSFGKSIEFINGLEGEAEIVIDDQRLMLRLFNKLWKQ